MVPVVDTPESHKRGPPVADPGLSFWQQTTRAFPHLHSLKDVPVPSEAAYVVIGSGIAGALLTYELIQGGVSGADIVMLEAREAASGASSRNAGHVRPDAFRGFELYAQHHGKDQALKILANERVVLEKVDQFIRANNISCDFNYTTTFDCCMTPEFAECERRNFEAFRSAGGDVSHVRFYTGEKAAKKTGVAGVLAAAVVEKGVRLFTHCPATSITAAKTPTTQNAPEAQLWDIRTPRGIITSPTVVHCTNGFTGLLLPELSSHIVPTRGQAHAIIPVAAFAGDKVLSSTYSLRYSLNHYYSVIQRQSDGTIIFGCSLPNPALPSEVTKGIRTIDDILQRRD
ncbi:hypothetical protein QQX98_010000 [Neonectria punicea]|uniref:FAD dependent oxidoreductase domain-containing protein n=1 Tax=Neonectria punicea TaxID=979145 RepID=A0ABR1GR55_9HYPO